MNKKHLLLLWLFLITIFPIHAQAKAYWKAIDCVGKGSTTINIDLNGDKRKEKIEIVYTDKWFKTVSINGKLCSNLHVSEFCEEDYYICIGDYNSKDQYKDIITSCECSSIILWRYNGKKLVKVAQDYNHYISFPSFSNMIKKKQIMTPCKEKPNRMTGNKSIVFPTVLRSPTSAARIKIDLKYKIVNGKFVADLSKTYRNINSNVTYRATEKMIIYKYPRMNNNFVAFSINKGAKYNILSAILAKDKSMYQIENVNTNKIGWAILDSNGIMFNNKEK